MEHVEQDHIRLEDVQRVQRLGATLRRVDLVPPVGEEFLEDLPDFQLVVHDQHLPRAHVHPSPRRAEPAARQVFRILTPGHGRVNKSNMSP